MSHPEHAKEGGQSDGRPIWAIDFMALVAEDDLYAFPFYPDPPRTVLFGSGDGLNNTSQHRERQAFWAAPGEDGSTVWICHDRVWWDIPVGRYLHDRTWRKLTLFLQWLLHSPQSTLCFQEPHLSLNSDFEWQYWTTEGRAFNASADSERCASILLQLWSDKIQVDDKISEHPLFYRTLGSPRYQAYAATEELRELVKLAAIEPTDSVLDVECGSGVIGGLAMLELPLGWEWSVRFTDKNAAHVARARSNIVERFGSPPLDQNLFHSYDFRKIKDRYDLMNSCGHPDGFDIVFGGHILNTSLETLRSKTFGALGHLLRRPSSTNPGGRLIVSMLPSSGGNCQGCIFAETQPIRMTYEIVEGIPCKAYSPKLPQEMLDLLDEQASEMIQNVDVLIEATKNVSLSICAVQLFAVARRLLDYTPNALQTPGYQRSREGHDWPDFRQTAYISSIQFDIERVR